MALTFCIASCGSSMARSSISWRGTTCTLRGMSRIGSKVLVADCAYRPSVTNTCPSWVSSVGSAAFAIARPAQGLQQPFAAVKLAERSAGAAFPSLSPRSVCSWSLEMDAGDRGQHTRRCGFVQNHTRAPRKFPERIARIGKARTILEACRFRRLPPGRGRRVRSYGFCLGLRPTARHGVSGSSPRISSGNDRYVSAWPTDSMDAPTVDLRWNDDHAMSCYCSRSRQELAGDTFCSG